MSFSLKAWVRWCHERGWVIIPVTYQGKDPCLKNWQHETLETSRANIDLYFPDEVQRNLGAKVGEDSGSLADIDLDCDETVALASEFLPPTLTFGRPSKPKSHWLYTSEDLVSEQFKDPLKSADNKSAVLVEIRANAKGKNGAQQTVFPPSVHTSGEQIAFTDATKPLTKVAKTDLRRYVAILATTALLARHWVGQGARHMAALACAGMLTQLGLTLDETVKVVRGIATLTEDEEIDDRETAAHTTVEKIQGGDESVTGAPTLEEYGVPKQVLKQVKKWFKKDSDPDASAANLFTPSTNVHPMTDMANAERFARQNKGGVVFITEWNQWLAWDGAYWKNDQIKPRQLAAITAKAIVEEAKTADLAGNPDLAKMLRTHAKNTQALKSRMDMIRDAQSIDGMFKSTVDLDKNNLLLAMPNGTLDLETGKFRDSDPNDYLTRLFPTPYDPKARCPLWEQTLLEIMDGDRELVDFLQLYAGYTLTGTVRREVMFLLWGHGSNGKSVLVHTLQHIFGDDNSCTVPSSVLLNKQGTGTDHPTGLSIMYGKRLAVSYETDMNKQLAEGLIKSITGGDKIATRRMNENWWEYTPRHTIWLATNHKPVIRGADYGIWRRIILIPFVRIFEAAVGAADDQRKARLRAEAAGIFNWILEGARLFLAHPEYFDKLPAKMVAEKELYKAENDRLGAFFEDCIEKVDGEKTPARNVWNRYLAYCRETGDDQISQTAFFRMLEERGFPLKRTNTERYRLNMKLKPTALDGVRRNLVKIDGGKSDGSKS